MKVGTKSLLFGVHQFLFHPLTVGWAWKHAHGKWPSFYEWAAIFLHDVGYWGSSNMDGPEGKQHPRKGAELMYLLVSRCEGLRGRRFWSPAVVSKAYAYSMLVLCHSRSMAESVRMTPSKLSVPDKESILFDPLWFYWLRATLSGEIKEYRDNAVRDGWLPEGASTWTWLKTYRNKVRARRIQNL